MRIGISSIIGDGFGAGSFSFGEVPSGGGEFPPNGTFYETLVGVEYPIAEGGLFISNPIDNSDLPIQVCDVDVYHDGTGGFYNDWDNATNVAYKPFGTLIWEDPNAIVTINPVEIPVYSGNYYDSATAYDQVIHDGSGWWTNQWAGQTYYPDGTEVDVNIRSYYQTEVPSGSDYYYNNGKYDTYVWDGVGGFYLSTNLGSFYANGNFIRDVYGEAEVPDFSGNFYPHGKYTRYNWNGTGGYTTLTNQGSFYASGTLITYDAPTFGSVEVPSGSGNYFDSEVTRYNWNGSGGFTDTVVFYPSGTFIYNDGTTDYFWNGNGGY